jgi:hypothetical protein
MNTSEEEIRKNKLGLFWCSNEMKTLWQEAAEEALEGSIIPIGHHEELQDFCWGTDTDPRTVQDDAICADDWDTVKKEWIFGIKEFLYNKRLKQEEDLQQDWRDAQ